MIKSQETIGGAINKNRDHAFLQKIFTPDYVQGYTAALLDVRDVFGSIKDDLKIHKRKQNLKTICQIIDCIIKHRVILREIPGAFVRCTNSTKDGFEIYIENYGVYMDQDKFWNKEGE